MDFGPRHYVPVLKAKRGEKAALGQISLAFRHQITPVLEIVERTDKELDAHLTTAFKGLAESLQGYPNCFLDARAIKEDGPNAAAAVFGRAAQEGINFTPVTGISRTADLEAALMYYQDRGLVLRLTRDEVEQGNLPGKIDHFLNGYHLKGSEIDLIIDLGAVDHMVGAGVSALSDYFLHSIPHPDSWRTLTMTACAFPMSMSVVQRHSYTEVKRADWIAWRNLYDRRDKLDRLPRFGDYAIQHVVGVEQFNPVIMAVSATIRYTLEEDWLLVKGESTKSIPPSLQFPVLAARLVYGDLAQHFLGPDHCGGCSSIKAAADRAPRLGSAEAWRRLGTIHHISRVMDQLNSLTWP